MSDGLGAKVRSRLSGAAPAPLGNVDVIGDGSAWGDGGVAWWREIDGELDLFDDVRMAGI